MKGKKHISAQLIGKNIGWFLASFITMETDADGRPARVIFTTQSIDDEKLKNVLADFEAALSAWKGELVDGLTLSYGYISREEAPNMSVRELGIIADKRMYEAKSAYYRRNGVDRRGHQDVHRALCELYTKILKINISDDTYQIVNMGADELQIHSDYQETHSRYSGYRSVQFLL